LRQSARRGGLGNVNLYTWALASFSKHALVAAGGALTLLLGGCVSRTHLVQQPRVIGAVRDATADQLVMAVNELYNETQSLSATVEFQASVGGARKGKVTDYTSFSGYILLSKPERLRVLGLVPVLHTRAFDLASDGENFKLLIPRQNKAIVGTTALTKMSDNPLENLRPNVFSDALLIPAIGPTDLVTLTTAMNTTQDAKTHQLLAAPEYDLTVVRRKENSQQLIPERVIHFSRLDLKPFQEDIYDPKGDIQTQAIYGPYQMFGDRSYPGTITIRRPLEEYQIIVTIEKLIVNQKLADDQFELKIPDGTTIQERK
jgi:hypothetical protein